MRKRLYWDDSVFHSESQSSFRKSSDDLPFSPTDSNGSVFMSSDGENGADERKKTGKSPNIMLHVPASEAEYFDDRKKIGVARTKISVESPFLAADIKRDSKAERKKHQIKSNAHFHKLFLEVATDEQLKQSFTCALQKEILYQGKLYISENWICFHSKVFGKDTKISIPVVSVTLIKKTKTALLVPNALIIATATERYIFVSLLSRDRTDKLLKSVCRHLEGTSVGNSPNPSSAENSFRADRPTTLPLDLNEEYSDLDGIVRHRRRELEESSSSGSQTPELEHFQDYHIVETQTHLKFSKSEVKSSHTEMHSKHVAEEKARKVPGHGHSGALGFFHQMKFQKCVSLNHVLIFYTILVCILIVSTLYMRYKINVLEERLVSMTSFDSHINERQPAQGGLGSHLQINADALCDELTANLIKLEKIQNNLRRLLEDGE
ncbi:GRAM domain-containing protein 3 isoform A [Alligator mississippiensis]|uniref:GRAM domain-containing protein 3 isoform A n=2 Tax=Alligator mississippiensis TaxID=8496 RepID=A0A151M7Y0_ALLMI|nr:GRAM domain-containing protein 3 isoform A [Alligator mississippiensis]